MKQLVENGQVSPESFIKMIKDMLVSEGKQLPENENIDTESIVENFPDDIKDFMHDFQPNQLISGKDSIDRQSYSVQIKQVDCSRTTIKDEKIKHTEDGGLHSDIEQALVISCEGKKIEINAAEGICEVSGMLAQKCLSCHLCHRSICLRHCEFIEHDGENYPYCNTSVPGSTISCAKKIRQSMNMWQEFDRKKKGQK